jgi:hypothetical protein
MTFLAREIDVKFQLGQGNFGESGADTVEVTGLRVNCTIQKNGGVSLSRLAMKVYGLSLSTMNQLSTLGKPLITGRNNRVTVTAGDANGKAVVFSGIIQEAWVDPNAAPEVAFVVDAFTGLLDALRPLPASSFQGSADAATIVAGLAQQMSYAFENAGVSVKLSNPYFPGTGKQQLDAVARAGDFNCFIDDVSNTVAIWPRDGQRGGQVPLISAETGLVGFPMHTQDGVIVTSLFNAAIVFGRAIDVQSVLTPANGQWTVFAVTHELGTQDPGAPWFTKAMCTVLGRAQLAPQ